MNSVTHAKLSCKAARTESEKDFAFFEKLHSFMDCSKEVESSNLHRALTHHLFFVKRVVIPIFGHSYICENKKVVNLKDDLEQNHLLADFRNKFIPTLSDYCDLISDDQSDLELFGSFRHENPNLFEDIEIHDLLLAPYYNTGQVKSLWVTHNTWFIGEMLPKIFSGISITVKDYKHMAPSIMFNRMKYADWVQNGMGMPPSFKKIQERRDEKAPRFTRSPGTMVVD